MLTPVELRNRGYTALLRELGPVDFVRFIQQFEPGVGDYTRNRRQWVDRMTMEQIRVLIERQQGKPTDVR